MTHPYSKNPQEHQFTLASLLVTRLFSEGYSSPYMLNIENGPLVGLSVSLLASSSRVFVRDIEAALNTLVKHTYQVSGDTILKAVLDSSLYKLEYGEDKHHVGIKVLYRNGDVVYGHSFSKETPKTEILTSRTETKINAVMLNLLTLVSVGVKLGLILPYNLNIGRVIGIESKFKEINYKNPVEEFDSFIRYVYVREGEEALKKLLKEAQCNFEIGVFKDTDTLKETEHEVMLAENSDIRRTLRLSV